MFFLFNKKNKQLVNEPVANPSLPGTLLPNPIELSELIQNISNHKYDELVESSSEDTEEDIQNKVIKLVISMNPNRPMPQSAPHTPRLEYPLDQYLYSPVKMVGYFYDPENKEIVPSAGSGDAGSSSGTGGSSNSAAGNDSGWDENSEKILLTSAISYNVSSGSALVSVSFNSDDRESIEINGQQYVQQSSGYYSGTIGAMDGGMIGAESSGPTEKRPTAIDLYLNMVVTRPYEDIILESIPTDINNFYFFYNGILLYPGVDYSIDENGLVSFTAAVLAYGDTLYAFENLSDVEEGCLKNRVREIIPETTKRIDCESLNQNSVILPFYNGELIFQNNYVVQNGSVRFVNVLEEGKPVDITECMFAPGSNLEIMFAGSSKFTSSYLNINGISVDNTYLVFYDGKLMMENVDYRLHKNAVVFLNGIVLDVNKKIMVLRV